MSKKTNPYKEGRPSLFNDLVAEKVLELYRDKNKTDEQVAQIIGVTPATLEKWKKDNRNFLWDTIEAKQMADELVELSLFKRATGLAYTEEQATKDGVVELKKYSVPDVKAQQFWLKNREPKRWKDRVEVVHEATGKLMIESDDGKEDIDV